MKKSEKKKVSHVEEPPREGPFLISAALWSLPRMLLQRVFFICDVEIKYSSL